METLGSFKIYFLSSPEDPLNVRYIGFTSRSLPKRLSAHMCQLTDDHRGRWIKSLLKKNLKPEIHSTKEHSCEYIAKIYNVSSRTIRKYKSLKNRGI